MDTFKSFAALAAHLKADDVRKAANLRKSQSLAGNRKQGAGPRVAR